MVVLRDEERGRRVAGDRVERLPRRLDAWRPVAVAPAVAAQPAAGRRRSARGRRARAPPRASAQPSSFTCRCASAQVGKWTCESVKPGRTQRPPRFTRLGLASAVSWTPTPPATRSPAIASARATGSDGSSVRIDAVLEDHGGQPVVRDRPSSRFGRSDFEASGACIGCAVRRARAEPLRTVAHRLVDGRLRSSISSRTTSRVRGQNDHGSRRPPRMSRAEGRCIPRVLHGSGVPRTTASRGERPERRGLLRRDSFDDPDGDHRRDPVSRRARSIQRSGAPRRRARCRRRSARRQVADSASMRTTTRRPCTARSVLASTTGGRGDSATAHRILRAVPFDVLTEEQREIRELVRDLARERIAPRAAEIDASHEFPWDVVELFREHEIFGLLFDEEWGGTGTGTLLALVAIEEVSKVCATSGPHARGAGARLARAQARRHPGAEGALAAAARERRVAVRLRAHRGRLGLRLGGDADDRAARRATSTSSTGASASSRTRASRSSTPSSRRPIRAPTTPASRRSSSRPTRRASR